MSDHVRSLCPPLFLRVNGLPLLVLLLLNRLLVLFAIWSMARTPSDWSHRIVGIASAVESRPASELLIHAAHRSEYGGRSRLRLVKEYDSSITIRQVLR